MEKLLLSNFGTSAERVRSAVFSLQNGSEILPVDDDNRENEGVWDIFENRCPRHPVIILNVQLIILSPHFYGTDHIALKSISKL